MLLRSRRRVASVPRRRSRAGPDRLAALPEEILHDILVRLPANSVLRCRAVCRSWRRLASDPAFLLDHHRRQPELALIRSYRASDAADTLPCIEALHIRAAEFRPFFGFPKQFVSHFPAHASCDGDGLFVVGQCICNPTTRHWAPLATGPSPHSGTVVALYRHHPSREYRVLYWTRWNPDGTPMSSQHAYCVLTVGTDQPRSVGYPVHGGRRGIHIFGAPVLVNGTLHLHWRERPGVRYHRILAFHTVAETFRHMSPPAAVEPRHAMQLLDMGGRLAASISKDDMTGLSIFALQDQDHDVWTYHYQIKLPVMDNMHFQHEQGNCWAKIVSEEGDLLVSCYGHLLHCDKNENLIANFKFDDDMPVVLPHRLKESLIQHTFFQKKKTPEEEEKSIPMVILET
ncbi:hypothetical protein QYE76_038211 [Lolium multiflorum]|uniref:F-box domain-containing protein n=1 Tax=Lolium multiflorum TaxID=4521 RepID=A0AAD8T931_LOLMU|nr:hypothetical protein QYE76_038211 [Lolium multiflorum]